MEEAGVEPAITNVLPTSIRQDVKSIESVESIELLVVTTPKTLRTLKTS